MKGALFAVITMVLMIVVVPMVAVDLTEWTEG
jgi:hypothetical protein